jgi:hypothetical protein
MSRVLLCSTSSVEGNTSFRSLQLGFSRLPPPDFKKNLLEEKSQTLKGTIKRCAYEANKSQTFQGLPVLQSTPFFAGPGLFHSANLIFIRMSSTFWTLDEFRYSKLVMNDVKRLPDQTLSFRVEREATADRFVEFSELRVHPRKLQSFVVVFEMKMAENIPFTRDFATVQSKKKYWILTSKNRRTLI